MNLQPKKYTDADLNRLLGEAKSDSFTQGMLVGFIISTLMYVTTMFIF